VLRSLDDVAALTREEGGSIYVHGSLELARSLSEAGLVDRYHLLVFPVLLGAGKSALARAVLRRLAGDPALEVPSPSFTLVQSYDLPDGSAAHHYDLYRLSGPADLAELGWDEAREGIVLVEWPDRLGALRPGDAIGLSLAPGAGEEERVATLSGPPERLRNLPA